MEQSPDSHRSNRSMILDKLINSLVLLVTLILSLHFFYLCRLQQHFLHDNHRCHDSANCRLVLKSIRMVTSMAIIKPPIHRSRKGLWSTLLNATCRQHKLYLYACMSTSPPNVMTATNRIRERSVEVDRVWVQLCSSKKTNGSFTILSYVPNSVAYKRPICDGA
jgi:hypothetical protein